MEAKKKTSDGTRTAVSEEVQVVPLYMYKNNISNNNNESNKYEEKKSQQQLEISDKFSKDASESSYCFRFINMFFPLQCSPCSICLIQNKDFGLPECVEFELRGNTALSCCCLSVFGCLPLPCYMCCCQGYVRWKFYLNGTSFYKKVSPSVVERDKLLDVTGANYYSETYRTKNGTATCYSHYITTKSGNNELKFDPDRVIDLSYYQRYLSVALNNFLNPFGTDSRNDRLPHSKFIAAQPGMCILNRIEDIQPGKTIRLNVYIPNEYCLTPHDRIELIEIPNYLNDIEETEEEENVAVDDNAEEDKEKGVILLETYKVGEKRVQEIDVTLPVELSSSSDVLYRLRYIIDHCAGNEFLIASTDFPLASSSSENSQAVWNQFSLRESDKKKINYHHRKIKDIRPGLSIIGSQEVPKPSKFNKPFIEIQWNFPPECTSNKDLLLLFEGSDNNKETTYTENLSKYIHRIANDSGDEVCEYLKIMLPTKSLKPDTNYILKYVHIERHKRRKGKRNNEKRKVLDEVEFRCVNKILKECQDEYLDRERRRIGDGLKVKGFRFVNPDDNKMEDNNNLVLTWEDLALVEWSITNQNHLNFSKSDKITIKRADNRQTLLSISVSESRRHYPFIENPPFGSLIVDLAEIHKKLSKDNFEENKIVENQKPKLLFEYSISTDAADIPLKPVVETVITVQSAEIQLPENEIESKQKVVEDMRLNMCERVFKKVYNRAGLRKGMKVYPQDWESMKREKTLLVLFDFTADEYPESDERVFVLNDEENGYEISTLSVQHDNCFVGRVCISGHLFEELEEDLNKYLSSYYSNSKPSKINIRCKNNMYEKKWIDDGDCTIKFEFITRNEQKSSSDYDNTCHTSFESSMEKFFMNGKQLIWWPYDIMNIKKVKLLSEYEETDQNKHSIIPFGMDSFHLIEPQILN